MSKVDFLGRTGPTLPAILRTFCSERFAMNEALAFIPDGNGLPEPRPAYATCLTGGRAPPLLGSQPGPRQEPGHAGAQPSPKPGKVGTLPPALAPPGSTRPGAGGPGGVLPAQKHPAPRLPASPLTRTP